MITGNTGTGFINGTKVASLQGQPPEGGGNVGAYVEAETDRPTAWEVQNFRVLKPQ